MRSLLFAFLCLPVFLCADVAKDWSRNAWEGYKPFAKHEFVEEALHIFDVQAEKGYGWRRITLHEGSSGDLLQVKAKVKGKGQAAFQLQYYSAEQTWLGVDPTTSSFALEAEWRVIDCLLNIANVKNGPTEKFRLTVIGPKDSELYIKDFSVQLIPGIYTGDLVFPQHWQVFADVDRNLKAPLHEIPASLGGKTPMTATLDRGSFNFAPYFAKAQTYNCAWLYAEIEAPYDCEYSVGAGADYFLQFFVNGVSYINTLQSGNTDYPPHFSNQTATAKLQKGRNLFAVQFLSGSSAFPVISMGGAKELRELVAQLSVQEIYLTDDYSQIKERRGNPKIVEDILTDGIETIESYGLYAPGSTIGFEQQSWNLPPRSGAGFFATGLRLRKLEKQGTMRFILGENLALDIESQAGKGELQASIKQNGLTLKKMSFPIAALPVDMLAAVSHNEFHVNITSLQDSKLRAFHARGDFSALQDFRTELHLLGLQATVKNYFVGLAKREVKSSTVPFKIAQDPSFDPVKAGWKLVWQDEFDGEKVDWENTWMESPWREKEYNREMASLRDGKLVIRCDFKHTPGAKREYTGKTVLLSTRKRFGYGYYEARVRFTKKPGWWAAFWMNDEGRNMSVGGGYELDIFEDYTTRRGNQKALASNLHVAYGPNRRSYGYQFELPGEGSLDDYYVVGCKWTPFEFSTYINGELQRCNARHSPYNTCTYDGINHGFAVTDLYIALSGQAGSSGGVASGEYSEEFLVDYVRAYQYPRERDPEIAFKTVPPKSVLKSGERFTFEVEASPSKISASPLRAAYVFDNGNLIDYKTEAPYIFNLCIDLQSYKNSAWDQAGRQGRRPVLDGYPHFFRVAVQDEDGMVAYTDFFPVITDTDGGSAYKGKASAVPGIVPGTGFNEGGQNIATYKQSFTSALKTGTEGLFSRKAMHQREAGEWASYSIIVAESGKYSVRLNRREYRRDLWPMRGLLLIDGVYVGDFVAEKTEPDATISGLQLSAGEHCFTVISACTYGVWPQSYEFMKQ